MINGQVDDPYGGNKFIGEKSEFVRNDDRLSHSVDERRSGMGVKFEIKNVGEGRHMDDPFIYGLGL